MEKKKNGLKVELNFLETAQRKRRPACVHNNIPNVPKEVYNDILVISTFSVFLKTVFQLVNEILLLHIYNYDELLLPFFPRKILNFKNIFSPEKPPIRRVSHRSLS